MSENKMTPLLDNSQVNTTIRRKIYPMLQEIANSHDTSIIDTLTALVGFCGSLPHEQRVEILNKGMGLYGLILVGADLHIDMPENEFNEAVSSALKDAPQP